MKSRLKDAAPLVLLALAFAVVEARSRDSDGTCAVCGPAILENAVSDAGKAPREVAGVPSGRASAADGRPVVSDAIPSAVDPVDGPSRDR